MSHQLFSLNADLRRLREDGYFVQVKGGLLIMREVPYVNEQRAVKMGTLISTLNLAGGLTQKPDTHVMHFDGDYPCQADGSRIQQIAHQSAPLNLGNGVTARHSFSSKPTGGYTDYHHKMTTYAAILSGPAAVLNPDVRSKPLRIPDDEEDSVFHYADTASDRAGIGALSERLASEKVAIIGLGGTGSYVLDLVAKTPAREIRLLDADEFLQHNAFRTPGAPSIDELRQIPGKVEYLASIYSRMHRGIVAHPVAVDASSLHLLDGITFAFVCIDRGDAKQLLLQKLNAMGVAYIDVGMGLELTDGTLGGILRVTTSTPERRDHVPTRVSFGNGDQNGIYSSNIQVADLNALNAALAVFRWKRLRGFYRDLEREHHSTFTTDGNFLANADHHAPGPSNEAV